MPLKAIRPGQRKGNRFYIFRGTVDGREYEITSRLPEGAPLRSLRLFADDAERLIRAQDVRRAAEEAERRVPQPGDSVTFRKAAQHYIAWRRPSVADLKRLDRIYLELGDRLVGSIGHADIVAAANALSPNTKTSTRNREVIRMTAAVMHYAAGEGWCKWLRVRTFREPAPVTRSVSGDIACAIISAAPQGPRRLYLLWLFRHGSRLSEPLSLTWEESIDLSRQVVRIRIGKSDRWREKPLHPEVHAVLAAIPIADRHGYLFPWRTRSGIYKWLVPLRRELGIHFTPHMARHTLATQLNAAGNGLKTIMEALDHKDPKSAMRYQDASVELVRDAISRIRTRP